MASLGTHSGFYTLYYPQKTSPFAFIYEPRHEISDNVVCVTSKGSDQPAHNHSLIRAFASHFNIL